MKGFPIERFPEKGNRETGCAVAGDDETNNFLVSALRRNFYLFHHLFIFVLFFFTIFFDFVYLLSFLLFFLPRN